MQSSSCALSCRDSCIFTNRSRERAFLGQASYQSLFGFMVAVAFSQEASQSWVDERMFFRAQNLHVVKRRGLIVHRKRQIAAVQIQALVTEIGIVFPVDVSDQLITDEFYSHRIPPIGIKRISTLPQTTSRVRL